ncbi:MAG: helix-turn-helix domain-containing protein [Phenylobacterium sp.]|uniref:helix-turn-helix domain-containing protein n=1 Tax=Phenylobacterium sp. TaxID=1871053 RepID=UPI0025FC62C9|nr:helix-turn-helix domain-containing protein [Phenylobacterium sp.]MBI1196276.1 helix-turn-helix domain-containing protein [Phenylobacterium sp.]
MAQKRGDFHFTTDDFQPHERVAAYEACLAALGRPQRLSVVDGAFSGNITAQRLGPILTAEIRTSKASAQRDGHSIVRAPQDGVLIFEQLDQTGIGLAAPQTQLDRVLPGDLVFFDANGATEVVPDTMLHVRTWVLPHQLFKQADITMDMADRGMRLSREHGMSAMVLTFLNTLRQQSDRLDIAQLGANAEIAARLVASAAGAGAKDEAYLEAGRAGQFALVKRRIREQLNDPLLSPGRIASDMRISVRKLHALFEPTGETFSQYVLGQRLAAAYALLRNPYYDGRPITDLALSLGFNSLATFYRAYGATFGETPSETRAGVTETA